MSTCEDKLMKFMNLIHQYVLKINGMNVWKIDIAERKDASLT
jgi:hypothetical protein